MYLLKCAYRESSKKTSMHVPQFYFTDSRSYKLVIRTDIKSGNYGNIMSGLRDKLKVLNWNCLYDCGKQEKEKYKTYSF